MCGIAGYIGKENSKTELLQLIKGVEYRGYDSAGIACINNNSIEVIKSTGAVSNLENKLGFPVTNSCGIAHTRWATHGKANSINAHPHLSQDKNWAIVHNGIIENYLPLKNDLIQNHNINFKSETDTETIAHLLQVSNKHNGLEALKFACDKLIGSYALAVISTHNPHEICVARNESPLYVAYGSNGNYIASDPICFVGKCTEYYTLNNKEYALITENTMEFFDNNLMLIDKTSTKMNFEVEDAGLGNYNHFMQKEISQEKDVINRLISTYQESKVFEKLNTKELESINNIILIGCGTAYHAALMGAKMLEKYARIKSSAYIASEFRYSNPIIDKDTLAIFVSQSGETADTLGALEIVKANNTHTIALTNVLYSTLAKNSDYIFPVCAGPELAVASTKAYTAQISVLYLFANYLATIKFNKEYKALENLSKFLLTSDNYFDQIKELSTKLTSASNVFFIGRDTDYITAEEASLKLKEITYINSSAYPSGELKHGFLALVDSDTILFVVATEKHLLDKTLNAAHEAYARGAKIVVISNLDISQDKLHDIYLNIHLDDLGEDIMPMTSIKFFQWLAYYTSTNKGINPDKPRNLAKSVTVE